MTVHKACTVSSSRSSSSSNRGAAIMFVVLIWVILVMVAQFGLFYAVYDDQEITGKSLSISLPRKVSFLEINSKSQSLFHPPPLTQFQSQTQFTKIEEDPADTVYGDDKRIIHTGPNPLHN